MRKIATSKIILTIIFIFIGGYLLRAQGIIEDYFPKLPDAAALSKTIDIPSGSYSGTANFYIPLYEFYFEGIRVPVGINYNASGIKVQEVASRVGLGWSLDLFGVSLSGQIMGKMDFLTRSNRMILPYDTDFNNQVDQSFPLELLGRDSGNSYYPELESDIIPDIFSYSTFNSSGHFIWDSSGEFGITIPYSQDKIEKPWKITDEKGFKYIFTNNAGGFNSLSLSNCASPPFDLNKIYNLQLSKILSPNGRKIEFDYTYNNATHVFNSAYFTSLSESKLIEDYKLGPSDSMEFPNLPTPQKCYNYIINNETIPNEISIPGGKIILIYNDKISEPRNDLPDDYFLKKLIVKNDKNRIIKDYSFIYDYFVSSEPIPQVSGTTPTQIRNGTNRRLKLKGIHDNLTNSDYIFNYYKEDKDELPNRMSSSYDYWGVYNGKDNETSISTTQYPKSRGETETQRIFLGADKNSNFEYGVIGNLEEIIYPTGGKTRIFYEPDEFLKEPFEPDIYEYKLKYSDYLTTGENMEYNSIEFEIEDSAYEFTVWFYSDEHPKGGGTTPPVKEMGDCALHLYKLPDESTDLINENTYNWEDNTVSWDEKLFGLYYDKIEPGNYKMVITDGFYAPTEENYNCIAKSSWIEKKLKDNSAHRKAGTIRIKKIEETDENQVKQIREYEYKTPESNYSNSSGKNIGEQYFWSLTGSEFPRNKNGGYTQRWELISNPGWLLSNYNGKSVGYSNVQEYFSNSNGERFKKEYFYYNESDNSGFNNNPYETIQRNYPLRDYERGRLLKKLTYNSNNDTITKTEYETPIFNSYFNKHSTSLPEETPEGYNTVILEGLYIHIKSIACHLSGFEQLYFCDYVFNYEPFNITNYWLQPKKL